MTPICTWTPGSSTGSQSVSYHIQNRETGGPEWRRRTRRLPGGRRSTTTRPSTRPTRWRRTASCATRRRSPGPTRRAGYWVLTDYTGGLRRGARRRGVLVGAQRDGGTGLNNVIPKAPTRLHIPVELDLPEHRAYRKVSTRSPRRRRSREMQPMIEQLDDLVHRPGDRGRRVRPRAVIGVPAVVTLDWLGLDVADWRRYSRALHSVLADWPGSPAHAHVRRGGHPLDGGADRRGHRRAPPRTPRDDLITIPPRGQEVDGQPITDDGVYSMVELLITGGVGTTASLVSQTLVHLHGTPTSGRGWSSTPSCSTGPSRSSSGPSRRPRRWPAP